MLQRRVNAKKRIAVEARGAENEQDGDDVALSGLQDMVRGHTRGPGSLGAELFQKDHAATGARGRVVTQGLLGTRQLFP